MTEVIDAREAGLVLAELNLPMMFVDLGAVEVEVADGARHVAARLLLGSASRPADIGDVVARLLRVELVSTVTVARAELWSGRRLTTACVVALARGDWEIELDIVEP